MANKNLFQSVIGRLAPQTDTYNHEGAPAYAMSPKHALAQYSATGCMNSTFYASAAEQLDTVLSLSQEVEADFVARTAIYAREQGYMKDLPALLCATLAVRDLHLLQKVFPRVIDNGKMLRNFVQILRSGVTGRKSLGNRPKQLVLDWLASKSDEQIFKMSVGNSPSLADIIKMVHPQPATPAREALYGYLLGRDYRPEALPQLVAHYEAYKQGNSAELPNVPFQMLTSLELAKEDWKEIARNAPWQMTRMNLNTFARHDILRDGKIVRMIANRLRDAEAIRKARVFPYQLLMAYKAAIGSVPFEIEEALQDAMEIATENVPRLDGKVYVCPDVSGSMTWAAVTGVRKGSTSAVRCIDVAALLAAAILRRNPSAEVLPFEFDVVRLRLNPRDSIMTNADKLAKVGGGGTNCSAPLAMLNKRRAQGDLVIFVSDNQSWVDASAGRGTATMREWNKFQARNPQAKLACIDIQPYGTLQAAERQDVLNVGGFSDRVFSIVADFAAGRLNSAHWVGEIENVKLDQ